VLAWDWALALLIWETGKLKALVSKPHQSLDGVLAQWPALPRQEPLVLTPWTQVSH
jgi:hypothetical protein